MRKNTRYSLLLVFIAAIAVVLAACGDSEASDSDEQVSDTTPETTDPAPASTAVETETDSGADDEAMFDCGATLAAANPGQYPGQYELDEYEAIVGCSLEFSDNPQIGSLSTQITHLDGDLPAVGDRLPTEPLVIAPIEAIGTYGGTLDGLSRANEAGTSDLLSFRHVNLVRYAPDLVTIMPNVAKSWSFNDDFTELTFELREGHKWSNGEPFTSEDVRFWLEDLQKNTEIAGDLRSEFIVGGEPISISVVDDTTFAFVFAAPSPGFLSTLATVYWQPFQPDEFLKQFHPDYNDDADAVAAEFGYESGIEATLAMWGCPSNWKDCGSPWLTGKGTVWTPTLESHILVDESTEIRRLVANPYFHAVDTAGQQLPYIDEMLEEFIEDTEVHNLRITNGEVDYKTQGLGVDDFPVLSDNQSDGGYEAQLAPSAGSNVFYAFNLAIDDPVKNEIFNDVRFRQAFSLALNRDEINELIYFGQGVPQQATPADPNTVNFVSAEQLSSFVDHDPDGATALLDEMGLEPDADGCRVELNLQFSDQGSPADMHELTRGYLEEVGICMNVKQVTSDEYRESASRNQLEMLTWNNDGTSGAFIVGVTEQLVPQFGEFFNPGPALHWEAFTKGIDNGVTPVEPPADVLRLVEAVTEFQQVALGTAESDALGSEIVQIHVDNLWKIGTVGSVPAPTIRRVNVGNVPDFSVHSYDFYWSYPFNTYAWFLDESAG
jgi:peptide/nickel transport system substrate-binding protein